MCIWLSNAQWYTGKKILLFFKTCARVKLLVIKVNVVSYTTFLDIFIILGWKFHIVILDFCFYESNIYQISGC